MSEEKKSGCLKYIACGCVVLVVLAIIGAVVAYFGFRKVVSNVSEKYTETSPRTLPVPVVSQQEVDTVIKKFNEFQDAIKQDKPAPELVLSGNDINVLINKHPEMKQLAGKVNVEIDGDKIKSELSVPLGELSSMFKGKYLNGSGTFTAEVKSGRLVVFADSIEVKGEKLPPDVMKALGSNNLAEKANQDPKVTQILDKIDSISVKDGKLHITPKKRQ